MKQQILVIHGGHRAGRHPDLLKYLRNSKISLNDLRFKGWKANLAEDLGAKYEIFTLKMPNPQMARYEEWKIWFEKSFRLVVTPILIGHSLGGIFLAKYFAEKKNPKKTKSVFLIAAPYFEEKEFALPKKIDRLARQNIFLYHSSDDQNVTFDHFEKYQKALPGATARIFKNRGHFHQEALPEIVKDIKSL